MYALKNKIGQLNWKSEEDLAVNNSDILLSLILPKHRRNITDAYLWRINLCNVDNNS